MGAYIPPGFAHIAIELSLQGDADPMYCTFGVRASEPVSGGGDWLGTAGLTAIGTAFRDQLTTRLHSTYSVSGVSGRFGSDPDASTTEVPLSLAFTGTGAPLPQNCAVLVRKVTALGGRRNTGRMFIPGASEGSFTETGVFASGLLTGWQTAMDAFKAAVDAATGVDAMYLLHSSSVVPVPAGFPEPTPVTALKVLPLLATQRRRLR
jgi:hypothetical protein